VASIAAAGLDSYAAKLMFGDWLWWSDQVNNQLDWYHRRALRLASR